MRSVRARSNLSLGMLATTSAMPVTKNTDTEKTSRKSFSSWPVVAISVKKNVRPTMERKRSLLSRVTMGRKNGMTVR